MELGIKLKELRLICGLTQEELGDRCELTKGYISQLENDLVSPSIATLKDILEALGTNLGDFFSQEEEKIVFKKADYFEKQSEDSNVIWLVPSSQKNEMEPILLELKAGMSTTTDMPHEGEEFGFVLVGEVTLHYGKEKFKVKKGETFYIASDKPHYLANDTDAVSKVIWVATPPTF